MATYGSTVATADPAAAEAWQRQQRLLIGPDQHGLCAGYHQALRGIGHPLPADQWLRRFAKAPGIRKDARGWYGIEAWLETQGTVRVSAGDLAERIGRREFSLEIGWSPEQEDTLLVTLPVNPASRTFFQSVHDGTPNVLLSIRIDNPHSAGGAGLYIGEIQSDWHQEGNQSGWRADPIAWKQAHKQSMDAIEDASEAAASEVFRDGVLMAAITPALLRNIRRTELPTNRQVAERCLWSLLRGYGAGEQPVPAPIKKGLPERQAGILEAAVAVFAERHRIYADGGSRRFRTPLSARTGRASVSGLRWRTPRQRAIPALTTAFGASSCRTATGWRGTAWPTSLSAGWNGGLAAGPAWCASASRPRMRTATGWRARISRSNLRNSRLWAAWKPCSVSSRNRWNGGAGAAR